MGHSLCVWLNPEPAIGGLLDVTNEDSGNDHITTNT